MTDIMSRLSVDLNQAIAQDGGKGLQEAAATCALCPNLDSCLTWIAHHDEGEKNAIPEFCKLAEFFRSCGA